MNVIFFDEVLAIVTFTERSEPALSLGHWAAMITEKGSFGGLAEPCGSKRRVEARRKDISGNLTRPIGIFGRSFDDCARAIGDIPFPKMTGNIASLKRFMT